MKRHLKHRPAKVLLTLAAAGLVLGLVACQSGKEKRQAVTPSDFTTQHAGSNSAANNAADNAALPADTQAQTQANQTESSAVPNQSDPQNSSDTANTTSSPYPSRQGDSQTFALTLDAMVGQVNGKAIYAETVFEPIEPQLSALGRTLPPSVFKQRASELIIGQLQTLVTNALILGEAERDLSKQERYGLLAMLKSHREELLRQFGEGSASVADEISIRRTGKNVDEQITDFREQVLVGRYISNQIRTKINVSRKDIERYYDNHRDEYNPPPGRTIRLIMVRDAANADHLQKLLASGVSFDEVAKSNTNLYRASQGGLMADRIVGDKFSGIDQLNLAMVKLNAGEHSSRIEAAGSYWWIKVETFDTGKGRSLDEVQLEIRRLLEGQQRNSLGTAFRRKLLDEGSYNPIDQMADKLIDIAMSRYSQPFEN